MPHAALLLVAYDVHTSSRRARIRRHLQGEAVDHQYSVYEQFPTASRSQALLQGIRAAKQEEDDLWAFAIDPRASRVVLGTARAAAVPVGWVLS